MVSLWIQVDDSAPDAPAALQSLRLGGGQGTPADVMNLLLARDDAAAVVDDADVAGGGADVAGDGADLAGDGADLAGDGADVAGDGADVAGDDADVAEQDQQHEAHQVR